jgi:flagellar hook-associated protein FlgK
MRAFTEPAPVVLTFGNAPTALTNRNILYNSMRVTAGTTVLVENTDYVINYRLGTIQMLHNGYDGTPLSVQYTYTDGSFKGPGDNANAIAIADLRNQMTMNNDVLGNPTATFGEYYSSFIGHLGLNRSEATSTLDSRNFLVKQYETQQESIAGVSLDDEMSNIIKYQHMYAASARLITVTSEMLDTLIKM